MQGSTEALEKLMDGNARYVSGEATGEGRDAARRFETGRAQGPFAAVLCCSDSRVPPEILFDAGIGDIFVIRVAGNVADEIVTGSIEYAVSHLEVPLVMVLGHTGCGAVTAALAGPDRAGHSGAFLDLLEPAIEGEDGSGPDAVERAARKNALLTAAALADSPPLIEAAVGSGDVEVIAALYDIVSGKVEIL